MTENTKIKDFLRSKAFAVAGASTNREKYGNKVTRCYMQHGKVVYPINPRATEIEGLKTYSSILDLPDNVESLSIITAPKITEQIVRSAKDSNIKNIWMQPGAESKDAIDFCKANGINVIGTGECVLVVLGYNDNWLPE